MILQDYGNNVEKTKPLILITNDDGIDAPGLRILFNIMKEFGEVIIVAPDKQQSAVSSALTIQRPIKVFPKYLNNELIGYAVDGTPTDCVKIALFTLLDKKPDLIVSGINHGLNTSINVLYSGTVSGAIEGMLMGINSIAISHQSHSYDKNLDGAKFVLKKVVQEILNNRNIEKILLNINIPDIDPKEIKGIKVTKLSNSQWIDKFEKRLDPWGNTYYWFTGEYIINDNSEDCDDRAIENGYISITPLSINFTDYENLNKLKHFENL
jgi:5'-nucleotidase